MSRAGPADAAAYASACLVSDLRDDIDAYLRFAGEYGPIRGGASKRLSALLTPSLLACLLYRVSHWWFSRGWTRTALLVARLNLRLTRATLFPASRIGGGLYIPHPATSVVFAGCAGRDLRLFAGTCVLPYDIAPLHRHDLRGAPVLGDDVAIGYRGIVIGAVRIGSGTRIGVNAVIDRSLERGTVALAARRRSRGPAPD